MTDNLKAAEDEALEAARFELEFLAGTWHATQNVAAMREQVQTFRDARDVLERLVIARRDKEWELKLEGLGDVSRGD